MADWQQATDDISSLIRAAAETWPDRTALWFEPAESVSFKELGERVDLNRIRLINLSPGHRPRVGIVIPNGVGMAVTLLSVTTAATAIPFNPKYREEEFRSYFRETSIDFLLVEDADSGPAVEAAKGLQIPVLRCGADGSLRLPVAAPADAFSAAPSPSPDDVALVLLTSGSTGRAKAVPLTHRNVCTSARDVSRSMGLGLEDSCLAMWEQFHIGGLVDLLLAPLLSGGTVICTPGFAVDDFFRLLEVAKPTWFQAVPTTLNELMNYARRRDGGTRKHRLRLIRSVAAPLPVETQRLVTDLFGVPVIQTYGLTEAGPLVTSTSVGSATAKPRSLGRSCGTEIKICADDWAAAPPQTVGPIAIRGANVFRGYENDPEANAAQFRDGWFLTGDLGYLDSDGELFVTGRTKQLINRGGEKVNPQEVDDALLAHPAIAAAASFPVPHRTLNEDVAAAITLKEGQRATADELREFLRDRLADFKVPSLFWFLSELPTNTIGKIDRMALTQMAANTPQPQGSNSVPGDELQRFLSALWALELDLDQIDIDGDFSALGGDSLSRARIVVAVEKALQIRLPDDIVATLTTIRKMAAWLTDALPDGREVASGGSLRRRLLAAGDAITRLSDVLRGPDVEEAEAERAWLGCRETNELTVLLDQILLYRTPLGVRDWLAANPPLGNLGSLPWGRAPVISLRVAMRRRQLIRDVAVERHQAFPAHDWSRAVLTENSILYSDPTVDPGDKTLLIGFCGFLMRLMLPAYQLLMHLDPQVIDLLLVRDPNRRHFEDGAKGLGSSIEEVAESLSRFSEAAGYRRVVTLGTSAGGLAAVCVGLLNGVDRSIAICPDSPLRHPALEACLDKVARADGPRRDVQIHYGNLNDRDRDAAETIAQRLPFARRSPNPIRNHNLLHELSKQGKLRPFLATVLEPRTAGAFVPAAGADPGSRAA